MKRKLSKDAISNLDYSLESESSSLIIHEKRPARKCQCCQFKIQHDYLREQRENRERISLMKVKKEIEINERNIIGIKEIQEIRRENWSSNRKRQMSLSLDQTQQQGYLMKEHGNIQQNESQILNNDSSLQVSIVQQPPIELSPHYKRQLLLVKSQLSSILEAENSASLLTEFNRVSNIPIPPPPVQLSISITLNSSTYSRTWSQKQKIMDSLNQLNSILY